MSSCSIVNTACIVMTLFPCSVAAAQGARRAERGVRVSACWSSLPIGRRLLYEFEARGDSSGGICLPAEGALAASRVAVREADVAIVVESQLPPDVPRSTVFTFPMGYYAAALVANSRSGVRRISLAHMASALQRRHARWDHIPSSRITGDIAFHCRTVVSVEWTMLEQMTRTAPVRLSRAALGPDGWVHQHANQAAVLHAVAEDSHGIGVLLLSPNDRLGERVVILDVATSGDSAYHPPGVESIAQGKYPLADRMLVICAEEASPLARAFVEFATGPEGAKIIRQFGLWPEYELEQVRGEQRLADLKAGKGQPVGVCDLAGVGEGLKVASWEFARAKVAVQVTLDGAFRYSCPRGGCTAGILAVGRNVRGPTD